MPPIQVYSASPINASKASGVTPQTQEPQGSHGKKENSEPFPGIAGPPASTTSHGQQPGLAARPGAEPSLPVQTGMAQPNTYVPVHPTPTVGEGLSQHGNPPAPQPGAVPVPQGRERHIPPPPKAGESASAELYGRAQATTTAPPRLPPQLAYQAPAAAQPIQGRSSTTTAPPATHMGGPYPTPLPGTNPNEGYANPLGYQQGAGAPGFDHYQGQGQNFGGAQNSSNWSSAGGDDQPGVWDTARKWATAAGESLAAAESEVWKKINKG